MFLNKYYILTTTPNELETIVDSLDDSIRDLFVGDFSSIRWNNYNTKCIVKTKTPIEAKPDILGDSIQYDFKGITKELRNEEWIPLEELI